MQALRLTELILTIALMAHAAAAKAEDSTRKAVPADLAVGAATDHSGVYGFAGARLGDNDPQNVIGQCVWIFDAANKAQVASGDCEAGDPGQFRVALKPGKYVVRGPGGSRPIEVKPGHWVKLVSIVPLPISF